MKESPEAKIQSALRRYLEAKGWFTKVIHGNIFQSGMPDLFCAHRRLGTRWIEVKNPKAYSFTQAQLACFQQLTNHGVGVWILTDASEIEYNKLFLPANWWQYLQMMGNSNGHKGCKHLQ